MGYDFKAMRSGIGTVAKTEPCVTCIRLKRVAICMYIHL